MLGKTAGHLLLLIIITPVFNTASFYQAVDPLMLDETVIWDQWMIS